jgi:hypothetical protein
MGNEAKLSGASIAYLLTERSMRFNKPVNTLPDPSSMKFVMPSSIIVWIDSVQRTRDISWA